MIRLVDPREIVNLEFVVTNRTVRMKLYPSTAYEEVDQDTAKHLYRLLQRYNWSLQDPARFQSRWKAFWPSISYIERKALTLLVMSNGAKLGTQLDIKNLPVELELLKGHFERVVLRPKIKKALEELVGRFLGKLTTPEELDAHLRGACRTAYEAILPAGGALLAFDNGMLLPNSFSERCSQALRSANVGEEVAHTYLYVLNTVLMDFLIFKEMKVWE